MTTGRAVLLAPGASSSRDHPTLVAIEEALAPVPVHRIELRQSRPSRAVAAVREEAAALVARTGVEPDRVLLGGRSFGGRMCSVAVADGLAAAGLVLISYPLHPPGRPDQLRAEHFPRLSVPCLFVSGTRDAFATPEELGSATGAITGPVTHVWLDGGDHALRRRDAEIASTVREWVAALA